MAAQSCWTTLAARFKCPPHPLPGIINVYNRLAATDLRQESEQEPRALVQKQSREGDTADAVGDYKSCNELGMFPNKPGE